jgi:acyl transferase domain-containing protein
MDDKEQQDFDESAIAIVGMACHLPGALNISEYWENLKNGVESVRFFTDEELLAAGETPENLTNSNYVRAQPYLENFDRFDASFWGFSPQDAAVTDPAHRLFLEVAYESLEHAGHTGYDSEGTVGVFAGSGASLYWMENLRTNPQLIEDMGEFLVRHTGNDMNFLATRLSYELDLRGPSINVQTACSSALVSVHMAAQSLLSGECDMAIAGGSTVLLPQNRGYIYRDGEILSPDGHCRPFDSKSAGTVFGSGAGAVVLRRLADAVDDGDTIYGVVRGTAINNDGAQKIGFLAPGVEGQAGAVAEALAISDTPAEDVSYIETHGTGTPVGDPIEFEALNQVYRQETDKRDYCRIGSVKSNIGHLGEAAGAASIIKVLLALQHKQIPASLNFESPNVQLDMKDSPFLINDQLHDWNIDGPLIAGVTALGAGGTNAHVILEEAPEVEGADPTLHKRQLITLSAKTKSALALATRNLSEALKADPKLDLADVAYTLQIGRRDYTHRSVIACRDTNDLIAELDAPESKRRVSEKCTDSEPSLVFMLPGGGAQYSGMGQELYETEAVYRKVFDECIACLEPTIGAKVKALVFAPQATQQEATITLQTPTLTLTSLFACEYALAKQLEAWGAKPVAMIGHSMGENTAACLAGVMSLYDAMNLVHIRGQIFEKAPEGGMLSISLPLEDAKKYMSDTLDVAAVNSPDLCVATGAKAELDILQAKLKEAEVDCAIVRINVAAHSRMLNGVLEPFRSYLKSINLSAPEIPFTSNLTGTWITDEQAMDPNYWVDHLRSTVRFADNIETVLADDSRVLVEIGPGRTLTNLARANGAPVNATFNSMRHPNEAESDTEFALRTLGKIWANGAKIDWSVYWGDEFRQRVPLPTYPFERKSYWIEPGKSVAKLEVNDNSPLKKRASIDDWYGQLSWQQSGPAKRKAKLDQHWLIFEDDSGLGDALVRELEAQSMQSIIRVKRGKVFASTEASTYTLNPNEIGDFEALMAELFDSGKGPTQLVYLWPYDSAPNSISALERYQRQQGDNFWALFNLAKVLGELEDPLTLSVISSALHAFGGASSCPEKALLLGPTLVIAHEYAHINTRSIDLSAGAKVNERLVKQVLAELNAEPDDDKYNRIIALRGRERWLRKVSPAVLDAQCIDSAWLKKGANVLITGGLGGIGLSIAKHFAERGAENLVLLGRSALPDKNTWDELLKSEGKNNRGLQHKITALQEIEALGANVITAAVDVADLSAMTSLVTGLKQQLGKIDGVIHAAGVMDDELAILKSTASAETVLSGKVEGALVLDAVFNADDLDFFVLFSSVASYLGLPGQIDYTAANAFLDAFAHERAERASGMTRVFNWNAWAEVGMTVDMVTELTGSGIQPVISLSNLVPVPHSVLDGVIETSSTDKMYITRLSRNKHWLLSEHVTKNDAALIPGTGFIELMRASFAHSQAGELAQGIVELTEVQFLSAFQVKLAEEKLLQIHLEGDEQETSLTIFSDNDELPHVTALAKLIYRPQLPVINLEEIAARCPEKAETQGRFMDQSFMSFGPRWACIDDVKYGQNEALLKLSLSTEFLNDLDDYKTHPALLDMATGCAQFLMQSFSTENFYVPVAYQKVRFFGDMPANFVSYIKLVDDTIPGFVNFDVCLLDASGQVFLDISGFSMKQVDIEFIASQADADSLAVSSEHRSAQGDQTSYLEEILHEAILPAEGVAVFESVMSQDTGVTQWLVSSTDSGKWLKQLEQGSYSTGNERIISFEQEDQHNADADPDISKLESLISAHKDIDAVIVRSFIDENSRRRLIAYYLSDDWAALTVTELRKYAREQLDIDSMPQQFIELDEFPVDENGELDRTQLLDPFAPVDNYIAPETTTQKKLAKIWQSVVGVNRVSLNENFFDIGGHSLLSIRVIVKVKKDFGVRLDQVIMVLSTLEQMAKKIDDQMPEAPVKLSEGSHKIEMPNKDVPVVNTSKVKKSLLKSFFKKK